MEIQKIVPFKFEDKEYQIKVFSNAWDFEVKAFLNDKPVNGYSYCVSLPTAIDLRKAWELDAIQILIENAKRDIKEKTWERYVENHIASLKKEPHESLGCRKCGSRNILLSTVDEREMYECNDCGNVWYSKRDWTSGPLTVFDDITDGVGKSGVYEIHAEILLNTVFNDSNISFETQLRNWANQNKLKYENIHKKDGVYIKFFR